MRPLLVALVLLTGVAHAGTVRRFALVVAENRPLPEAKDLATLRYADDDGARYWSLFRAAGAQVTLLAVLDADTQRHHPTAAAAARAPTRANLARAVETLNQEMQAARDSGDQVDFYFVFAGHGEVGPNGEGRIHLRDGFLTRREFVREVIAPSRADYNHVIMDACHASALVFRRGGEDDGYRAEDYSEAIGRYLDDEDLDSYPNTGVLLASSATREAHEWEVFRAGVFSHEVRSGLVGAADINGDGLIEYVELAAFVAAANLGISSPQARPDVVTRPPPVNRHRPLFDVATGPQHFLKLPRDFRGRAWLEDDRGERYADFHAAGEAPLVLALAPATAYYLRRETDEAPIAIAAAGTIDGAGLAWRPKTVGVRGAVHDAFQRQLYGVPFGPGFFQGYVASTGELGARVQRDGVPLPGVIEEVEPGRRFGPWPYVTAGFALAAGAGAVWLGLAADADVESFEKKLDRTGLDDPSLRARVDQQRTWSNVLAGTAGVAAAAAITLFILDGPSDAPALQVAPSPGGFSLGGTW